MSEFGLKIRNYEAAVLYEHNLGIREYATYTDAMFSNSLLSDYLKTIGLTVTKAESTSDIVCIKFSFGTRDYEDNKKRIQKQLKETEDEKQKEYLQKVLDRIEANKDKYKKISAIGGFLFLHLFLGQPQLCFLWNSLQLSMSLI